MPEKSEPQDTSEAAAWAGPALFITVLVLIIAFFWWFVQA
jgi:hypothetical protein